MVSKFRLQPLALTAVLGALALNLSACSNHDAVMAEQVMEAKQAADRAEAAQKGAEAALARITKQTSGSETQVVEETTSNDDNRSDPEEDNHPEGV